MWLNLILLLLSGIIISAVISHVPIRFDWILTSAIFTFPVPGVIVRPNLAGSWGSKHDDDAPVSGRP